jgi:hypothetical protein
MRVKLLLPIMLILGGCVVKQYGGVASSGTAEQSLEPVDFSEVEAQLEVLIAGEHDDVDRRDRLEAAWELLQKVKTSRSASQQVVHRYLVRLIELEQRAAATLTDALATEQDARFTPIASIQGEDLSAPDASVQASAQAPQLAASVGAPAILDASRRRMNSGDLEGAMAQLEVCRSAPCWTEIGTLWGEVRDRMVYQEQERAGQAYLAARALADKSVRLGKLQDARKILVDIQKRYPNTRYAKGIADKIARVDAAISEAIAN